MAHKVDLARSVTLSRFIQRSNGLNYPGMKRIYLCFIHSLVSKLCRLCVFVPKAWREQAQSKYYVQAEVVLQRGKQDQREHVRSLLVSFLVFSWAFLLPFRFAVAHVRSKLMCVHGNWWREKRGMRNYWRQNNKCECFGGWGKTITKLLRLFIPAHVRL